MQSYYEKNFEAGEIIAALNKNFTYCDSPDWYESHILNGIEYTKAEVIFRAEKNKKTKNKSNMGDIISIRLKYADELPVMNAIEKLMKNPYVIYAEPSYLFNMHLTPNDPYFGLLWGAKKIKSPLAWNYTTGNAGIAVGVLDSGIDYNHPDIKNNMWRGGQYAGHINGWNFFNDNNNPTDSTGHGTHVAGTIGAVGNNFTGIAGICWNIQVASLRIGHIAMSLQAAVAAIYYAGKHNIAILNNSWGGRYYSPILKYAIEEYNGLFIASAGNYGVNNDFFPEYPASYDSENIISVAATDQNDALSLFSNYGPKSVDIAAPGTDIFSLDLRGGYSYQSGTSMAAPHAAGAAALLKAYMPDLSALDMKNIILSGAEKLPALNGKILTGGILNLNAMLETANRYRNTIKS